jgi:hypothetical protein
MKPGDGVGCRNCGHFRNDAAFVESAFAGLSALGSAWGSTRADDGLCMRHERHVAADAYCPDFSLKDAPG